MERGEKNFAATRAAILASTGPPWHCSCTVDSAAGVRKVDQDRFRPREGARTIKAAAAGMEAVAESERAQAVAAPESAVGSALAPAWAQAVSDEAVALPVPVPVPVPAPVRISRSVASSFEPRSFAHRVS